MKRYGWILAAAVFFGALLAGMIGYMVWHMGQDRYPKTRLAGVSQEAVDRSPSGENRRGGAEGEAGDGNGAGGFAGDFGDGADRDGAGETSGGSGREDAFSGQGEDSQTETLDLNLNGEDQGDASFDEVSPSSPLRVAFGGDVLLSNHVLNAYDTAGNIGGALDQGFQSIIETSDIFMVNQEFPFSHRGTAAEDKQFTFRLPPERVSILQEMGIDIVTLANNHALDFGTDALLDTCRVLDEAGIRRVGAGADLNEAKKPVIMEIRGRRIGFLGASRVIPVGSWNATATGPGMLTTYDPAALLTEIQAVREECDLVIVYVHWGIEKDERPQEYQRTLGRQYIDAGADMVIGSHPHVLQGIEYYQGKPIVYSLGNFIFGSSIPRTALLTVAWDGEKLKLRMEPGVSSGGYTRTLTDEAEKQRFYEYMTSISYGAVVDRDGCREQ